MQKGQFRQVLRWDGVYVWIEKRRGNYFPYESHVKALLGIVSPSLFHKYDQPTLEQAFNSGFLNQ